MSLHLGIDTGGTFTDVVARDAEGRVRVYKVLSTPDDPSRAIASGVFAVGGDTASIVHGTTVATNALLERTGDEVAFVTTAGFEDILRLARQNRPSLYDLRVEIPMPLAGRGIGATERIGPRGEVWTELTAVEVDRVVSAIAETGAPAVAVCLLHSYASDIHERALARAIRAALPGLHVSISSELVREFREYERSTTTVINSYVGPLMSRYIGAIAGRLPNADVEVLLSSGARATMEEAALQPVQTVLSGPAGGVVGALAAARESVGARIITLDMGGTSTDVSLCDGDATLTHQASIGGFPIRVPVLDIHTVGAGGGSIAYRDPGGALRVGPRSAGAEPGPACYGRGGTEPTVTDAHVALGRLRPDRFLGGEMELDVDAARRAVSQLGASLGLDAPATARGILDIADAAMVRAIKVISSQRGLDPREYALVAFGGAGGLHACRVAGALQMRTVLIPARPGVLSAYGMLHADRTRFFARSVLEPLGDSALQQAAALLREDASGFAGPAVEYTWLADVRYAGQSFEITVDADGLDVSEIAAAFVARHRQLYGYADEQRPAELVVLRLEARVPARMHAAVETPAAGAPSDVRTAMVGFGDEDHATKLIDRSRFDGQMSGPLVLSHYGGTTVVPPGWVATASGAHTVLRRTT